MDGLLARIKNQLVSIHAIEKRWNQEDDGNVPFDASIDGQQHRKMMICRC